MKKINTQKLQELKSIALSDKDVMQLVEGRAKVILYSELHKYKTLDELLEPYGAIFLLYELKKDYGHWCAVFKQDENTIEFFDSYGNYLDNQLKWIPKNFRKISDQWYPHLTALFYNSPYKNLTYNEYPFQHKGNQISTCGRWSSLRLVMRNLPLNIFADVFKHANSDDIVTYLTSPDLNY